MHIRMLVLFCVLAAVLTVAYRLIPLDVRKQAWTAVRPHLIPVALAIGFVLTIAVLFYTTGALSFS